MMMRECGRFGLRFRVVLAVSALVAMPGWAAAVGGLSVSAATAAAGGAAAVAAYKNVRLAEQMGQALKEEPPSRVRIICEKKLAAMGIPDDLAKQFLDHPQFTPRHDLVIAENLSQLKGARGRGRGVIKDRHQEP